jgi:hypothetical protein
MSSRQISDTKGGWGLEEKNREEEERVQQLASAPFLLFFIKVRFLSVTKKFFHHFTLFKIVPSFIFNLAKMFAFFFPKF